MSSFTDPLIVEITQLEREGRALAIVKSTFTFGIGSGVEFVRVDDGFQTDFASVPRFLWWLFPPLGRYAKAAVIHDYLCAKRFVFRSGERIHVSSARAHKIFYDAMLVLEVQHWKAYLIYTTVKLFGPKWE